MRCSATPTPQLDPSNATSGECSLEQERLILGFALHGEQDNSPIWARFRAALGLRPDQSVPDSLWSLPLHQQLSREIEAIFQGQRDLRTLNGHTLIESTRCGSSVVRSRAPCSRSALTSARWRAMPQA